MNRPTVLVLDGPSLAHRAYHAFERQATRSPAGEPIWAVFGFIQLFAAILNRVQPAAVVVGWDGDGDASVRRRRFPQYKATRPHRPPELVEQMAVIPQLVAEAGFASVCPAGWEADDVLASVAAAVEATAGARCVVATSDRDAFGLISTRTHVLRLVNGGVDNAVLMGPHELLTRYGLRACPRNQYLDFAALRGDPSDNLPGVHGIGEKTAVKLLAALGDVEAALADEAATVAAVGRAFAERLSAGAGAWRLNRDVMALRTDIPVDLAAARRLPRVRRVVDACARRRINVSRLASVLEHVRAAAHPAGVA